LLEILNGFVRKPYLYLISRQLPLFAKNFRLVSASKRAIFCAKCLYFGTFDADFVLLFFDAAILMNYRQGSQQ